MPKSANFHYFSKHPNSKSDLKKIFTSVGSHAMTLQTDSGVFSPDEIDKGTQILLENLIFSPTGPVLDLGSGYGPIAIWLYKEYSLRFQLNNEKQNFPQIYASEINERALFLLNRNFRANDCKDIIILKGDFLSHIDELKKKNIKFQAIYTNPPLKIGHEPMLELFNAAFNLLTPTGFIQYVHKKSLGAIGFLAKLQILRPNWFFKVTRKKAGYHIIVGSPINFSVPSDENDHIEDYSESKENESNLEF